MRPFHGVTKLSVMGVSTERVPLYVLHSAVSDPDLEIRGGGHPDPGISGGAGLQKYVSALRVSVWSKNRGGWAHRPPPLDPPLLYSLSIIGCYNSVNISRNCHNWRFGSKSEPSQLPSDD